MHISLRNRVRIVSLASAFLLCSTVLTLSLLGLLPVEPNIAASGHIAVEEPSYVLGAYEGKLAVYRGDTEKPVMLFDVWLHNLPDLDQTHLNDGITVQDYRELQTLIEDFTS